MFTGGDGGEIEPRTVLGEKLFEEVVGLFDLFF